LAKDRVLQAEKEKLAATTELEEVKASLEGKLVESQATESKLRKSLLIEQERHEKELEEKEAGFNKEKEDYNSKILGLEEKLKSIPTEARTLKQSKKETSSELAEQPASLHTNSQQQILSRLNLNKKSSFDSDFEQTSIPGSSEDIDDTNDLSGSTSILRMQRLQAKLKLKTGEVQSLKLQLAAVERSRDTLAEEMVRLTDQTQKLKKEVANNPVLQRKVEELQLKQDLLLDLLGEKEERVDELEADIEEVKTVYRAQVDALAEQLQALNSE